jgi:preprotein translocase subunit SecA
MHYGRGTALGEAVSQPAAPQDSAAPSTDESGAPACAAMANWKKVQRNDPCPCGSGKKFKKWRLPKLEGAGGGGQIG